MSVQHFIIFISDVKDLESTTDAFGNEINFDAFYLFIVRADLDLLKNISFHSGFKRAKRLVFAIASTKGR